MFTCNSSGRDHKTDVNTLKWTDMNLLTLNGFSETYN